MTAGPTRARIVHRGQRHLGLSLIGNPRYFAPARTLLQLRETFRPAPCYQPSTKTLHRTDHLLSAQTKARRTVRLAQLGLRAAIPSSHLVTQRSAILLRAAQIY